MHPYIRIRGGRDRYVYFRFESQHPSAVSGFFKALSAMSTRQKTLPLLQPTDSRLHDRSEVRSAHQPVTRSTSGDAIGAV